MFDYTDVRIWFVRHFFNLYQIPNGFNVQASTMHMSDTAAHWYQSFKLLNPYHDWDLFKLSVLDEFEVNTHKDKLAELLSIRQSVSVAEYRRHFGKLMYHIRLYDETLSETLLVTQFILGLQDEIRVVVEMRIRNIVAKATQLAAFQEAVIVRKKKSTSGRV